MSELEVVLPALPPTPSGSVDLLGRYAGSVMQTYGTPQRVLVRGEGAWVWDAEGRRYLDLLAGIATNSLGHAHPLLVATVTAQLATLGHVSNFFASSPQIALAEQLLRIAGAPPGSAVFFCNSGAEAIEAAIKISRRTGRHRLVAAEGGFHGRTMGALSLTHKPAFRTPFEPLVPEVTHVPFGDIKALEAAVDDTTAAVVLEVVQGEAGVRPAPDGYLSAARQITRRAGALLVLDEVQTGIGRTGAWFAYQRPDLGGDGGQPDVVTVAKGLGGGIPIGAAIAFGDCARLLGAGQHGTTFGGNPVACAAGLAVLHAIERDGLLASAREVGEALARGVSDLGHPLVRQVRGVGLLWAVVLAEPVAAQVSSALLEAGFIVNAVQPNVIRLAPPLVISRTQVDDFLQALPTALQSGMPGQRR